ncbi:Zinc finger protein, partial [Plecturocebus cupreus]
MKIKVILTQHIIIWPSLHGYIYLSVLLRVHSSTFMVAPSHLPSEVQLKFLLKYKFLEGKSPFSLIFFFLRWSLTLSPRLECRDPISIRCNLCLLGSSDSSASASSVVRITGMRHHVRLIFVFLVETGFHMLASILEGPHVVIMDPCKL